MKLKITVLLIICLLYSFILFGCAFAPAAESRLKVSLTDAPAVDNFEAVNVTIAEVKISKATEDDTENWITLSDTPQVFDLMQLTGGALATLGVKDLAVGQYNQIRFIVSQAEVVVDGTTYPLQISSGTVKLVNPFRITEGIDTELVIDFNVAHSIQKPSGEYTMSPVTRLIDKSTTGAISGTVILDPASADSVITVSTTDADLNPISTICNADGTFLLGFLPPGTYNLTVEANGYVSDTSLSGIEVSEGEVTPVSSVTLTQP